MATKMSPDERTSLTAKLETVIAHPPTLMIYVRSLQCDLDGTFGADLSDTELGGVLADLMESRRGLGVLDDDLLLQLSKDRSTLMMISSDVITSGSPAWDEVIARVAPAPSGYSPDSMADLLRRIEASKPLHFEPDAFGDASFGEVLSAPPGSSDRLRAFDRQWETVVNGGTVKVNLVAFLQRASTPGAWYLRLDGALPADNNARIEVSFTGWPDVEFARSPARDQPEVISDITIGVSLASEKATFIELTKLGDPSPFFEKYHGSVVTSIEINCIGQQLWHVRHELSIPSIGTEFMRKWAEHEEFTKYCLNQVLRKKQKQYRILREEDFSTAIQNKAYYFYRRRFVEDRSSIKTPEQFSDLITQFIDGPLTDHVRQIRSERRKGGASIEGINDPETSERDDPLHQLLNGNRRTQIWDILTRILGATDLELLHKRFYENPQPSYDEIARTTGNTAVSLRARVSRALGKLARILGDEGFGPERSM